MEDYSKALRKILNPSLFLFLVAAASAHLGFALFTGGSSEYSLRGNLSHLFIIPGLSTGILLFALAAILLPFIYGNRIRTGCSRKETGKEKLPHTAAIKLAMLIILACIIAAGILSKIGKRSRELLIVSPLDNSLFRISGEIIKMQEKRYGTELILMFRVLNCMTQDNEKIPLLKGHLYLQENPELNEGERVTLKCRIKKIGSGRETSSYRMNLLRQGIHYSLLPVAGTVRREGTSPPGRRSRIRKLLAERIDLLFPEKTSSLVKALFFGERKHISRKIIKSFMKAGVLHVLAASGLHVGILASLPLLLLGIFRVHRRIIFISTFALLILYLFITGMPVSLVRATIMFAMTTLIFLSGLEKNMINILFLSALTVVVAAPEELYTPGFQLSFGATLGIIIFYRIFREIFSFLPGFMGASVSVTLSAQVFVLPLVAHHMENINFTGILSNIAVIPSVSLLMVISLLSGLASLVAPDAGIILGRLTDGIYTLILKFINLTSHLNGHFTAGPEKTITILICTLSTLFLYPLLKRKNLLAIPLVICIFSVWYNLSRENQGSRRKFTHFESRGKRSLLINNRDSRFLMGNIPDIKTAQIIIRKIDEQGSEGISLIITDPDFNNALSYGYIMQRVEVNRCIISPRFEFSYPVKQLFRFAEKNNIKIEIVDIRTDTELLEENHTNIDETGYAGALAAFSKFISEGERKIPASNP